MSEQNESTYMSASDRRLLEHGDRIKAHIAAGGEYRLESASGLNFLDGSDVVGVRIFTRGMDKPLNRWKRGVVIYGKGDQTLTDLMNLIGGWVSHG